MAITLGVPGPPIETGKRRWPCGTCRPKRLRFWSNDRKAEEATLNKIDLRLVMVAWFVVLLVGTSTAAQTQTLQLDGRIGETKKLPAMPVAHKHWGGNSSSQDEFAYEPPPGWIILSFRTLERSRYGDSWYTPQLTSRDSSWAAETKFNEALDDLEKYAGEYKNDKAKLEIQDVRTNSSQWSSVFRSTNNILRIKWGGRSRQKKVAGVVVDTDTASLNLDVEITIARSLSKSELELMIQILEQKIKDQESISSFFSS